MKTDKKHLLQAITLLGSIVILLTACASREDKEFTDKMEGEGLVFEAEDGICEGEVKVEHKRKGYGGTGYVTGFVEGENYWHLTAEIPKAGHYTLIVSSASDSYKHNYLTVNGKTAGAIETMGTGEFEQAFFESVYLEKGENVFSINRNWGCFDLDSITVKPGEPIQDSFYEVKGELVNPNANEKTKAIMEYLMEIYGKKTLAGQYTDHGSSAEVQALMWVTQKYPAIRGFDFIFYSPNSGRSDGRDTDLAIEWDQKGGLTTFSWHWFQPIGSRQFATESTDFDLTKAVTDKDIALLSLEELAELRDKGEISEECYLLISDMDAISAQLSILQENNVTVLWRPLHEASGGWFWWGAKGAEPYKWLWRLMYERQTNYNKLNNLIWVWNGQAADWYPGDDVVDIVGTDIYVAKHDYSPQTDMLLKTSAMAPGKPVAMTENGIVPDCDLMDRDNAHWLWYNTWCREFAVNYIGLYDSTYTEEEQIQKVYNSDTIVTLDELPDFNGK